jgi:Family of unknown function (DUF6152)
MFDRIQTVALEGTVKEFQWTNPHSWIMLTVAKEGQSQLWAVEMMGPGGTAGLESEYARTRNARAAGNPSATRRSQRRPIHQRDPSGRDAIGALN